jgi:hypothetical protein
VSGKLHAPADLLSRNKHPVPIEYESGWTLQPTWTTGEEKILDPTGTPTPSPQTCYTDCAIPAPVSLIVGVENVLIHRFIMFMSVSGWSERLSRKIKTRRLCAVVLVQRSHDIIYKEVFTTQRTSVFPFNLLNTKA